MRSPLPLVAALTLLFACSPQGDTPAGLDPVTTPGGELPDLPDPDQQGGHVGRAPRRITVEQLRRSIEIAVGRPWTGLASVADSLGEADYALIVSDSAEPNVVFAKFLEDGARTVCRAQGQADIAAATAAERVLARELPDSLSNLNNLTDEQLRQNLVYLSTRFWGWPLQGEDLDSWTQLFRQLATRAQAVNRRDQALTAVCIALIMDPRFSTY